METANEWLGLATNLGAVLAVLGSPLLAWLSTKFVLRQHFRGFRDEVKKDLRSMGARLSKAEHKISGLPTRAEVGQIDGDLKGLRGDLRALTARIDGLTETMGGTNALLQTLLEDRLQRDRAP